MAKEILPYGKVIDAVGLGRLIRQKRKADGLTQAEAAALCGVGTRFLSEVERGKATAELGKVIRVARGLGLELSVTTRGGSRS